MSTIKHAVISCAGLGSRLGLNQPKALVDFLGKTLVHRILELLESIEDVRIVSGFMEKELMKHVLELRKDVVFVRNDNYINSSNLYSLSLAAYGISDPYIIMDGDLIIDKTSFESFVNFCANKKESVIGITESKTEEAVFVDLDDDLRIINFHRNHKTEYEWSGIAYISNINIVSGERYVYSLFEPHLPLKSYPIKCYEIDTPADMELALREYQQD
ncbi:MAG: NTP transferase domain-containing protein [Holosporales bacterium]|jgi:choline kinase|nr:NTP transferase domain-containing protein [Holosporales bacterium]